jgi:hypothetical protein
VLNAEIAEIAEAQRATENREQRTENREQRTENREQKGKSIGGLDSCHFFGGIESFLRRWCFLSVGVS